MKVIWVNNFCASILVTFNLFLTASRFFLISAQTKTLCLSARLQNSLLFLTRGYARAYYELLQGQGYANESLAHSYKTDFVINRVRTRECEDLSFPKKHALAEVRRDQIPRWERASCAAHSFLCGKFSAVRLEVFLRTCMSRRWMWFCPLASKYETTEIEIKKHMFCVLLRRRVVSALYGICSFIAMKCAYIFAVNSSVYTTRSSLNGVCRRKFHGKGNLAKCTQSALVV